MIFIAIRCSYSVETWRTEIYHLTFKTIYFSVCPWSGPWYHSATSSVDSARLHLHHSQFDVIVVWSHLREMQRTLCHLIWVAVRAAADWWVISRRSIENESAAISIIDCFSDFSSKTCQVFANVRICCLSFTIVNKECFGFGQLVGRKQRFEDFPLGSGGCTSIFPSFLTFHFHFN